MGPNPNGPLSKLLYRAIFYTEGYFFRGPCPFRGSDRGPQRLLQHCGDLRHEQRLGLAVATKVSPLGWEGVMDRHCNDDGLGNL